MRPSIRRHRRAWAAALRERKAWGAVFEAQKKAKANG